MKTWADEAGITPPARTLDRDKREGPRRRCCARRFVPADELVFFGDVEESKLDKVTSRFGHMAAADLEELYLCGACRETLRREQVISRNDMPSMRPLQRPEVK